MHSDPERAVAHLSILHVLAPARAGGLERVVHALAIGHHRAGHDVRVAAVLEPGAEDHPFVRPLEEAGVPVARIVLGSRSYLRERREVARLCRARRPAVMHTHGYRTDVLHVGLARSLGIPVVTTVHGFTGGGAKNRVYEWLQRRAFRRFDAVVAVSRPLGEALGRAGVPRQRLHVLPNAWPGDHHFEERDAARRALGVPADAFHIGWVGRLSPEKAPDVLLEALGLLRDLPFVASFIGAGPEQPALERRASQLGLAERVRWHGLVPEAGRWFRAFDALVLSSRTEGTPIVLFEAIAAGVPIVATRVGGVPDVLGEDAALLVEPEMPEEIARALRAHHDAPGAAAARARAARERLAREFSVEPWLARYEAIYRAVARQPRA
ncbi:MAG TPA: glycosyltransferase [Longimicrobiales bacterium]